MNYLKSLLEEYRAGKIPSLEDLEYATEEVYQYIAEEINHQFYSNSIEVYACGPDGEGLQWNCEDICDKPFGRINFFHNNGDWSVGIPDCSCWALSEDQTGCYFDVNVANSIAPFLEGNNE